MADRSSGLRRAGNLPRSKCGPEPAARQRCLCTAKGPEIHMAKRRTLLAAGMTTAVAAALVGCAGGGGGGGGGAGASEENCSNQIKVQDVPIVTYWAWHND